MDFDDKSLGCPTAAAARNWRAFGRWPLLLALLAALLVASLASAPALASGGLLRAAPAAASPADRAGLAAAAAAATTTAGTARAIALAGAAGSGAALERALLALRPSGASPRLGVWRLAPPSDSGGDGDGAVGGVPIAVRSALQPPFPPAATAAATAVVVEDGAIFDRRAATLLALRALREAGDGGVAVFAPAAVDLVSRLDQPARAAAYGLGDAIFGADLAAAADSPYELAHALLDLMHCVDATKHEWTAFEMVLEGPNKELWGLAQELEAVDFWPGGVILSRRRGAAPPPPEAPLLSFEAAARALRVVPDKVSSHTYGRTYEAQLGRLRVFAQRGGGEFAVDPLLGGVAAGGCWSSGRCSRCLGRGFFFLSAANRRDHHGSGQRGIAQSHHLSPLGTSFPLLHF